MALSNGHTDPNCPCGYCVAERQVLFGEPRGGHGGKREGAGRKGSGPGRITFSASIPPDLLDALRAHHQQVGGRFSDTVEHFLRHGLELPAAHASLIGKEFVPRDGNPRNYDVSNVEVRDAE